MVRRQHGVIARWQLLDLGFTAAAIRHRLRTGRLRRVHRGVYAVGRPELTQNGRWMAAVLACGPGAALSHGSAAALWEIRKPGVTIHVSVPASRRAKAEGVKVHRRAHLETAHKDSIPLTSPTATLIDLATQLSRDSLEGAINEADKLDLIDPERLREELDKAPRRPGVKRLRVVLDRHTFRLTDSTLERRFLKIVRSLSMPLPETQHRLDGFRTDFTFADLGLVVEADSLRYHRTPAQQAKDRVRDQEHHAAGRTPLRFTHWQIYAEPDRVARILLRVAQRAREMRRVHAEHEQHGQPDIHARDHQPRPRRHVVVPAGLG